MSARVPLPSLELPAIAELAATGARFVTWRLEPGDNGKPSKVPYRVFGDIKAATDKPVSWGTFDEACEALNSRTDRDGIGFIPRPVEDGIIVIDLDGCIDPTSGEIADWGQQAVNNLNSYTELSPSGTGLKVFARAAPVPQFIRKVKAVEGAPELSGKTPQIEILGIGNRYTTLTGQHFGGTPIEIRHATDALADLAEWMARPPAGKGNGQSNGHARASGWHPELLMKAAETIPNDDLPWDDWNSTGMRFWAASGGSDDGKRAFEAWSAKSAKCSQRGTAATRWAGITSSPPTTYNENSLLIHARKFDPEFPDPRGPPNSDFANNTGATSRASSGQQSGPGQPEPLDIIGAPELVGWPEMTADCLPEPLFRYVTAEAERLNVDPCSLAVHVIAACAASISDDWRFKPKRYDTWTQQARLWSCVVKDVGARGTEIIRSAFWPIRERDKKLFVQWRAEHAEWKERQAEQAKERKASKISPIEGPDDPEPKCKRLVSQDATIEAASEILKTENENSKLTLLCDELVAFLGGFGRYTPNGSAARALWLEAYDGGPQMIDRIKRGHVYVPNWSVIVAGNIQPRRLAGMARDLIDDGLFQRFLTVHTRPATLGVDDDEPLAIDAGQDYRDLHTALAALQPVPGAERDQEPRPAYADEDARAVRRAFIPLIERLQIDTTLPTVIREAAPKWSGTLARMSLIFHLVELAERQRQGEILEARHLCQVTGPTVTTAATFLRRVALPNLFRLGFETMPEEGAPAAHARWLAGHILAHQAERIIARDIGRAYRPLRGKPLEIEQAMAVLCDAGWARPLEGRYDSPRWSINPAVHTLFAGAAGAEKERRAHVLAAIRRQVTDL